MEKDEKEYKYLIFRIFSKQERLDVTKKDQSVFFAWSSNKSMIKAFMMQRDKKKYKVMKLSDRLIHKEFSEDLIYTETKLDFVKLKSVKDGSEVVFFTTAQELQEAEIRIQRMFHDASSFENLKGDYDYVQMFLHLDPYYFDALTFLGYRPKEVDILFPSADERDDFSNIYDIEESINIAYGNYSYLYSEESFPLGYPMGVSVLEDVASRIIYSLESFIKVLGKDL